MEAFVLINELFKDYRNLIAYEHILINLDT